MDIDQIERASPNLFRQALNLPRPKLPKPDDSDIRLFFLSFLAFFVCFYTLLL
ncbi:hypothetical protein ACPVPU_00210 [Sphingomonas sp. CJ99]